MRITVKWDPETFEKLELTKRKTRRVIVASHVDLDRNIRDQNPFDTGFSVGSWWPAVDGVPSSHPNPPEKGGSYARGASDPAVLIASIGHVLTLANSAPYIRRLAAGYSPQAPAGWLEAIANMYQDFIDKHAMIEKSKGK